MNTEEKKDNVQASNEIDYDHKEQEEQNMGIPAVEEWLSKGLTSGNKDYLWWCVNQIEQGKLDEHYKDDEQQQLVSHMIRGIHQCVEWQNEDELEEEEREPAAVKLAKYTDRWIKQEETWKVAWEKKNAAWVEEERRKKAERIRKKKLRKAKRRAKEQQKQGAKDPKDKSVDQKDKSVDQKDKSVDQKDKSVDQKDKSVDQKDKSVDQKEDLDQKDKPDQEDEKDSEEKKGDKYVVFPSNQTPSEMPDLSDHHNYMSQVLHNDPKIYDELKTVKTTSKPHGVGLARCIKTGIENPAPFFVTTAGLVAGDLECFDKFKRLFDPVLRKCHENYRPESKQEKNLDTKQVDSGKLDPDGKYVSSVRLSTGRSLQGFCLPPAIDFTSRRTVERAIVDALNTFTDEDIKGEYFPLQYQKKLKKSSEKKFQKNQEDIKKKEKEIEDKKAELKQVETKKENKKEEKKELEKKLEELKTQLEDFKNEIKDDDYSLLDGSRSCFDKLFGISKEKEEKLRNSIVLVIDAKKAFLEYKQAEAKAKTAEDAVPTDQKNKDGKETAAQAAAKKAKRRKESKEKRSDAAAIAAAAAVADAAVAEVERDEAEAMADSFQFPSYSKEIGEWNEARPKLLRRIRMIEQLDFEAVRDDDEELTDEKKREEKRVKQIKFVNSLVKQLNEEKVEFKNTRFLSSGCERHWPDARGFFHNKDHTIFVRVNEQDHMRVVSAQEGEDIQGAFKRLVGVVNGVETVLKNNNRQFMRSDHLGYVVTCPSSLGTGLCASALVKIPKLSKLADFQDRIKALGLQARIKIMGLQHCVDNKGNDDLNEGYWNLSNAQCYGNTEVELMNTVINGIRKCIELEKKLERGEDLDEMD